MGNFSNRSLRKASEKLTAADQRLLERFTCAVQGCGKDFTFEISKGSEEQNDQKLRVYYGRCGFCDKRMKLTNSQFARWGSLISGSELRILGGSFDQIFSKK